MARLLCLIAFSLLATSAKCDDLIHAVISNDGKSLHFKIENQLVFSYNHKTVEPPNGINEIYRRSGYIHPVYSPNGKIVTDDFSDDHAHQHGVFFAFVKAKSSKSVVDFWNQHSKKGNVEHSSILSIDQEQHVAKLKLNHIQLLPPKPTKSKKLTPNETKGNRAKGNEAKENNAKPNNTKTKRAKANPIKQAIFEEIWTLSATKQSGCFVIELKSEIKNVTSETILIQKNHYGSFGIRGAGAWRKPQASKLEFDTSSGKKRIDGNQSPESWAAMSGLVEKEKCGVAVICSQKNFRFPQPVRLHPTMPYFSFAPMASAPFEIKPQEMFESKYRIVTFDGKLDPKTIENFTDF